MRVSRPSLSDLPGRAAAVAFAAAVGLAPGAVAIAHPHVFVETRLAVTVEKGRAVRIDVEWRWDDFFTLLIFEDMGLDPDGDAVLDAAELERLRGFDFEVWPEGFEGDLYAYTAEGTKIPLAFPEVTGIAVEDGRIVSRHARALDAPADGLELRQYDPTYYVAYSLAAPVRVLAEGCAAKILPHDPDAAAEALDKELSAVPEDMFEVLEMGIHFADRVVLSCASPS